MLRKDFQDTASTTFRKRCKPLQILIGSLHRFRENCATLTADIEEMLLRIQVPEERRRYLRFLWTDGDGKLMPYIFAVQPVHFWRKVIYNMCKLCSAAVCKMFGMEHPTASQVGMDNVYVEEMLLSVHTTEQASEVIHELKSLLAKGGFNLSKWFSNFEEKFEKSEITPIEIQP